MRRGAIGVFNGNWKNKWNRDLEDMTDRRQYIIEENKASFGDALDTLKAADPEWESWYDQDENIPPFIHWLDTGEVETICKRMTERAIHAKETSRQPTPESGEE